MKAAGSAEAHAVSVLSEPTLTLSTRRADYHDCLLAVSTGDDWDAWIGFFTTGPHASAKDTERSFTDLLAVQADLLRVSRHDLPLAGRKHMPVAVVAVDLAESSDVRTRRAGLQLLTNALAQGRG